ncbi:MAG TPA: hypothetical protein VHC23_08500, partial [Jatrophihabitans sp.]|nr:hypothetical protein [Jatrophihabitans sp.]
NAAAAGVQSIDQLARMFLKTAQNYEAADAASTPGGGGSAAIASVPCISEFRLAGCTPPSAAGSSGGGPPGWGLIAHAVGYVWPDGHQDRLRRAGHAWHRAAQALRSAGQVVIDSPLRAIGHGLPEADDMWTVCSSVCAHLRELGDVCDALGASCEELATHIDHLHASVIGELQSLVEWTAGIEAAGGLFSIFTFGAAEVPAQAAEAARITRTAAVVAGFISRFLDAARSLAASVSVLSERAGVLGARLRALLDVPLVEPVLAGVGPMRMLREAKEVQAAARLGSDEAFIALRYLDNPKLFDPEVLRGMNIEDVRAAIPKTWKAEPSKSGGGMVYDDPLHYGRQIRLMPGYPKGSRPDLVVQGPYAVISQNGRAHKIPLLGNPVLP